MDPTNDEIILSAPAQRVLEHAPYAEHRLVSLAGKLIANGYPIIPVRWGHKNPTISGWQEHWRGPPTAAEVTGWLGHRPDCGVGIACGRVVGVDIDVLDPTLADELRLLALDVLGPSPCLRIGRAPKLLLVYRAKIPLMETLRQHPIEILGQGAQFVAYNLHEKTGRPYDWQGANPVNTPLVDLPNVTEAQCREFLRRTKALLPAQEPWLNGEDQPRRISEHGKGKGTYRAIASALKHIPNSGEGVPYQTWINCLAYPIKHSLGMDGFPLFDEISRQSNKYNQTEDTYRIYCGLDPDGRRTVGTIYAWAMDQGWKPDDDLILNADIQAAMDGVDLSGILDRRPNGHDDGVEFSEPEPELESRPEQPLPEIDIRPPDPGLLLHPGGLLEEVANWITGTNVRSQPTYALGAAISLFGFLGAHNYRLRRRGHDTRTNLIMVALGPSASGKDHPRRCLKAVLEGLGMGSFLSEDLASGQALEGAFVPRFANLVLMDEYGHRISAALQQGGNLNERKIIEVITKLSTSPVGRYVHTRRAIDNRAGMGRVAYTHDPCLVMFATTVEEPFWQGLTVGSLSDGSLARHLFVRTNEPYPSEPELVPDFHNMLPEIIEHSKRVLCGNNPNAVTLALAIARLEAQYYTNEAGQQVRRDPLPPSNLVDVEVTPEAEVELVRLEREELAWLRWAKSDRERAMVGRLVERISGLGTIAASSEYPERPVLLARHVLWAEAFTKHSLEIAEVATRFAAETPHHVENLKLLRNITKLSEGTTRAGGWVHRREVTRVSQWIKVDKLRQSMIDDLVEGDFLERRPNPAAGKGSLTYLIRPKST